MQESIRIGIVLILVVQVFLFAASSIRFQNWSDSEENDIVFGIPFWFILFGTIGSFLTVGLFGLTSIAAIPVLLFLAWRGKLKVSKPKIIPNWHIAGLLLSIIFFLVKFLVLYDPITDTFFCTFHDDYSYMQQINLLESQRAESIYWELLRLSFNLDYIYKIYHFVEFYFIILFKSALGGNSFVWFNFFLKPILNILALFSGLAFFRSRFKAITGFWPTLFIVILFYSALRFNLIDEKISELIPSVYWKSVFFQNYYFPSPLSYHVSYKIALAYIFLIPLFMVWEKREKSIIDLMAISAMATLVSVAYLPYCGIITAFRFGDNILTKKTIRFLAVFIIICLVIANFILNGIDIGILRHSFLTFFRSFNLIFENYYWQLLYFSILLLVFTRSSWKTKLFGITLIGFPIVYVSPNLFFKIYALIIIIGVFMFFIRNHPFIKNPFTSTYLPTLMILFFLVPIIPGLADLSQVFSNYLFPLISLGLIEFLFSSNAKIEMKAIPVLALILVFVHWPAIAYDNRTPIHQELIPEAFFQDEIFKENCVNIISITKYPDMPYIEKYKLGNGILNRMDNVAITTGGFDDLTSKDLEVFRNIHAEWVILRNPFYQEVISKRKPLIQFLRESNVKVVLIANDSSLNKYRELLSKLAIRRFDETKKGYQILILR